MERPARRSRRAMQPPFLVLVLVLAVIAAIAVAGHLAALRRRKELAALAAARGWSFDAGEDSGMSGRCAGFDCLLRGDRRYAFNVMRGDAGGRGLLAFDYHYQTYTRDSKGRRHTHHHRFSAVVRDSGLPLQPLVLRGETFFDKVGEFLGFDDIDFESTEFNRRFHVKSPDRRFAYDVLSQETMEFLLGQPTFTLEIAGSKLMARRDGTFAPDEFDQALKVVDGVLDRLPRYLLRELEGGK